MFYFESVIKPLDTLEEILENFFLNQTDKSLATNQPIFEKYFFISLYTIWETYMSKIITEIYMENEKVLNSNDFDYYYYENIFTSRALQYKLKKIDSEGRLKTVQPELIFSTSNLWFDTITKIFKVYGFDVDSLNMYLSKNEELDLAIKDMVGSSIELTVSRKTLNPPHDIKQTNYHKVDSYISFLVDRRNKIAHRYSSPYPKDDPESMKKMINLFKNIFNCFDIYVKDQLLEKNLNEHVSKKYFKEISLVADKRAKNNEIKVKVVLERDIILCSDTIIVLFEEDKPIYNKYKIFKVLKVNNLDVTKSFTKNFRKNKELELLLESTHKCGGMKKRNEYKGFIDEVSF